MYFITFINFFRFLLLLQVSIQKAKSQINCDELLALLTQPNQTSSQIQINITKSCLLNEKLEMRNKH